MDPTPKYTLRSVANNTNTAISIVNLFTGNLPSYMKLFVVPAPLINTSFLIDLCENMVFSPKPTLTIHGPQGVGVLQISSDRDDRIGGKSQNPKNSLD